MAPTLQATLAGNCPGSTAADCRRPTLTMAHGDCLGERNGAVRASLDLWNQTSTFTVFVRNGTEEEGND
jgi:hypothetical protein